MIAQPRLAPNIKLPRYFGLASKWVVDHVCFPVLIKPVISYRFFERFGCKLFVARDATELTRYIEQVESAGLACELFEWIPGGDDRIYAYCTYIDQHGEPHGGTTIRKIRQSPPFFGVARVAEAVANVPEMREMTLALLQRISFRGMAAAEFKQDERDGSFRFIELNGRSVIYNSLLRRAGLDLARLGWMDHIEHTKSRARFNGWPGVWINLHADLFYSALRRREQRIGWGDFIAPYTRPIIEACWASEDPGPFITQWSRTLRDGLLGSAATTRGHGAEFPSLAAHHIGTAVHVDPR